MSFFEARLKSKIPMLVMLSLALQPSTLRAAGISVGSEDSHGMFRVGTMSFAKTDGAENISGTASVLNYEYSRNFRLDQSLLIGWRQATDAATKRDAYHSAYVGYRIFPFGIGFPVLATTGDATIAYDSKYKLYGEASVGLGHMLFQPIAEGAGDFSSETLAIALGGGMVMHFFGRWAVDVQLMYESVQSRGGTANALAASATHIYGMIGTGLFF